MPFGGLNPFQSRTSGFVAGAILVALAVSFPVKSFCADDLLYTGAFSRGGSKGIYAFRFDASSGKLSALGLAAEAENPTYLAISPDGRFLYAVINRPEATGGVSAYEIDRQTGKLKFLNTVSSRGGNTCFVSVSHSGRYAFVANYQTGSVAAYPIGPDGRLGEASGFAQHSGKSMNAERQEGPHAHSINPSPDDRFAIVADLGIDQMRVYRLQEGRLAPNDPAFTAVTAGSGPRHFAFDPSGRHGYAVEELASQVAVFSYDARRGVLRPVQTVSALPPGFAGTNSSADVQVHPSGRYVYASNRGHDSIAVFARDAETGKLTRVENVPSGGRTPRIFAIDPTGRYLIVGNEGSDNLTGFRIQPDSGRLTFTGEQLRVPQPTCVKFVPARSTHEQSHVIKLEP